MNDRELMQQALDALEAQDCAGFAATIEAIRARLAQPEQADCDGGVCGIGGYCDKCPKTQPEPVACSVLFPRHAPKHGEDWIIDPSFLLRVYHSIDPDAHYGFIPTMEEIETALLALEVIPSNLYTAPPQQEPPCKTGSQCIGGKCERCAQPEQEPVAWTPVAEEMPKSGLTVLACYKNRLGNVRRIRAQWVASKTDEASSECEFGEYDEEADTYWTPEGWYECIDNWDEYSSVAVHEGEITHWMLMPSDPYTAPPQREFVGLTDEEINTLAATPAAIPGSYVHSFARAIEAKLKEENK